MIEEKTKKIFFVQVTDNSSKLNSICQITHKHFNNKETVLIAVPSQEAAIYIDQLLWRHPNDSFLPHAVVNTSSNENVAITASGNNVNQAKVLINLCPDIPKNLAEYAIIYDLFDQTHPTKEQLALNRQAAYQALGYEIVN